MMSGRHVDLDEPVTELLPHVSLRDRLGPVFDQGSLGSSTANSDMPVWYPETISRTILVYRDENPVDTVSGLAV
jgi:hypothetical protein